MTWLHSSKAANRSTSTFTPLQSILHQLLAENFQQVNQIMLLLAGNSLKSANYQLPSLAPRELAHLTAQSLLHTRAFFFLNPGGLCACSSSGLQDSPNSTFLIPCSHDKLHLSVRLKKRKKKPLQIRSLLEHLSPLNSIPIFVLFIVLVPSVYVLFFDPSSLPNCKLVL